MPISTARPPLIFSTTLARLSACPRRPPFPALPGVAPMRALVRKQDVSFDRLARPVEHHFNDVAGLDGRFSVRLRKLRRRNQALDLAPDVDDDFFIGNTQDVPVQNLAFAVE